jgi:hypothetical protein
MFASLLEASLSSQHSIGQQAPAMSPSLQQQLAPFPHF